MICPHCHKHIKSKAGRKPPLTPDQIAALVNMASESDHTYQQIGDTYGISAKSAALIAHNHGVPKRTAGPKAKK